MSLALKKGNPMIAMREKQTKAKLRKHKRDNPGVPLYSMDDGIQLVGTLLYLAITNRKQWVTFEIYERTIPRNKKGGMAKLITWSEGQSRRIQADKLVCGVEMQLNQILGQWRLPLAENPIIKTEQETNRRIRRKVTLHLSSTLSKHKQLKALAQLF